MLLELNTSLLINTNYKIISLNKTGKLISIGLSKFNNTHTKQSLNFELESGEIVNIENINDLEII